MAVLLERYAEAAKNAGVPRDQFQNLVTAGIVLERRQLAFAACARECDKEDGPTKVGYGGARGGGKSHASLAILYDDCMRCPGLKCLFLRKVLKSARESFNDLRLKVLSNVQHTYKIQEGILEFPNGSKIILGHFKNETDIDGYLGLEYDVICIEESTTLTASKRKSIRTCLRTSKPNWRPREYHTTNPGGVGHADFRSTFILPFRSNTETETRFIPATVDDNSFLNNEYTKVLDSLTGWLKDAWRYGDWDIAAGQFFTNYSDAVHVIKAENFTLGKDWRKWAALDYGFTHFTACHLFAEDGDGNRYCFDEHGERGKLPAWHAESIIKMLARHGLTVSDLTKFVAGTDVFAKRGDETTIAEKYADAGIKLEGADTDRINGAGVILTGFGDIEPKDGSNPIPPRLFIVDRCARLIETLPYLLHDPHRPEDVLKVDCDDEGIGGDDFYDSFRYGAMVNRGSFGRAIDALKMLTELNKK